MTEPRFAYGFWRYSDDEINTALEMLELARANGIDHLDTADIYGFNGTNGFGAAERLLGEVRKRAPALLGGAVLATKVGIDPGVPYDSSAAYLTRACENSLKRLGVERIDLLYIHRPDILTHPADLAATLDGLVDAGKIAAVGVSNFTAHQVDALARHLRAPIAMHQIEFSALCVTPVFDGVLDQAMRDGIAVAAWSPLAGGRLTEHDDASLPAGLHHALRELGRQQDVPSIAAAAIAFVQHHPARPMTILGTKSPEHLLECLKATQITLDRSAWYAVLEASLGRKMP